MSLNSDETIMDDDSTPKVEVQVNPIVHLIAPLVAIGATMIVRKVITAGYRRVTGNDAPKANDVKVPFGTALMWAVGTAAIAAGVELVAYRVTNQLGNSKVQI